MKFIKKASLKKAPRRRAIPVSCVLFQCFWLRAAILNFCDQRGEDALFMCWKTGHHQQDPSNELCLPNAMEGECFWQPKKKKHVMFQKSTTKRCRKEYDHQPKVRILWAFRSSTPGKAGITKTKPSLLRRISKPPRQVMIHWWKMSQPPKDLGSSKDDPERKMAPNRLLRSRRNSGSSKKAHRC